MITYNYSESTNIICFNELIFSLNIKSNIKSFPINDKKGKKIFNDSVTRVLSRFFISVFYFND